MERFSRDHQWVRVGGDVGIVGIRRAYRGARPRQHGCGRKAWFFKIKLANAAELGSLMDRTAYQAFVNRRMSAIYRAALTTSAPSAKRLQRRLDLPNANFLRRKIARGGEGLAPTFVTFTLNCSHRGAE